MPVPAPKRIIRTSRYDVRLAAVDQRVVATVAQFPTISAVGEHPHQVIREVMDQLRGALVDRQNQGDEPTEPLVSAEFHAIKLLVDAADPEGLLGGYCPPDEYEPEVQELLARLDEVNSAASGDRLVRHVFGLWFGTSTERAAYPEGRFDELARGLAALAAERRSQ